MDKQTFFQGGRNKITKQKKSLSVIRTEGQKRSKSLTQKVRINSTRMAVKAMKRKYRMKESSSMQNIERNDLIDMIGRH